MSFSTCLIKKKKSRLGEDVTTQVLKSNSKFLYLSFNGCVLFEDNLDLLLPLWLLGDFLLLPVQEGFGISSYAF